MRLWLLLAAACVAAIPASAQDTERMVYDSTMASYAIAHCPGMKATHKLRHEISQASHSPADIKLSARRGAEMIQRLGDGLGFCAFAWGRYGPDGAAEPGLIDSH
jgi:hypothetical protein